MSGLRTRTVTAALAGVLLLAPLAACGGGDDKDKASAKPTTSASADDAKGSPVETDAFFTDVLDAIKEQKSVHLDLDGGEFLTVEGDLAFGETEPAVRLSGNFAGGERTIIGADGAVFIQQAPGGKYVKLAQDDPTFGMVGGLVTGFSPDDLLDGLKTAATSVAEVGPAEVDGTEVTQYAVTVVPSKVSGAISSLIGAGGTEDVTVQFLLDEDKLVRQLQLDLMGATAKITLSDWGKPVEIEAPSGDQLLNQP